MRCRWVYCTQCENISTTICYSKRITKHCVINTVLKCFFFNAESIILLLCSFDGATSMPVYFRMSNWKTQIVSFFFNLNISYWFLIAAEMEKDWQKSVKLWSFSGNSMNCSHKSIGYDFQSNNKRSKEKIQQLLTVHFP